MSFADSYLGKLRHLVGTQLLIVPGNRAIIENEAGQILLMKSIDFGSWTLPSGSLETGESAKQGIVREILEETGLHALGLVPVGLASEPHHETIAYPNGDQIQNYSLVWHVTGWQGALQKDSEEALDLKFFHLDNLPNVIANHYRSIEKFLAYQQTGVFQLH